MSPFPSLSLSTGRGRCLLGTLCPEVVESTWESLWTSGSPARGVARVRAPWEGLGQRDSWRVGSQQRGGRPRSRAILLEKGGSRGGEGDFRPAGGP